MGRNYKFQYQYASFDCLTFHRLHLYTVRHKMPCTGPAPQSCARAGWSATCWWPYCSPASLRYYQAQDAMHRASASILRQSWRIPMFLWSHVAKKKGNSYTLWQILKLHRKILFDCTSMAGHEAKKLSEPWFAWLKDLHDPSSQSFNHANQGSDKHQSAVQTLIILPFDLSCRGTRHLVGFGYKNSANSYAVVAATINVNHQEMPRASAWQVVGDFDM